MKRSPSLLKLSLIFSLCLFISGCATMPKGFLKMSEKSLENRQLQTRQYETKDEMQILSAVAGVLQDLGFTLDDSEKDIGFIAASKKADATDAGQIAAAVVVDVAGALFGVMPGYTAQCDKAQKVKASVITAPSLDGSKIVVRVTFQRIVWNMSDRVSKIETISDIKVYEKFYADLSKAIFLEAEKI